MVLALLFVNGYRPGAGEMIFLVFESSCHLPVNSLKDKSFPLSALPNDTTSEFAGLFSKLFL